MMDGRRRPASFSRAAPGAFAPGGGVGAAGVRPTSASRRLGPGPDALGGTHSWGKERRHFNSETPGLTRQASAPSLAPNANANMSFESFARTSPHGVTYDPFARSPALRRSSS